MGKLNFSSREITKAFENKLALDFGTGSERNAWYTIDGKKTIRFTMPKVHKSWGSGTIHDIMRRTLLTRDEFADLVACPLSAAAYEAIVRERTVPRTG